MSVFDAPLERCEAMRSMVLTDQLQRDCAREHGCPAGMVCPLCGCFTGHDWGPGVPAGGAPESPSDAA